MSYIRSRKLASFGVAIVVLGLLDWLASSTPIVLPNFAAGGVVVQPLVNVFTIALALSIVALLQRRSGVLEAVAVRRKQLLAYDLLMVAAFIAVTAAFDAIQVDYHTATAFRMALGTLGLAFFCTSIFESRGLPFYVVTAWYFLNVCFGVSRDGSKAEWWAWYAAPAKAGVFVLFPAMIAIVGVAFFVVVRLTSNRRI